MWTPIPLTEMEYLRRLVAAGGDPLPFRAVRQMVRGEPKRVRGLVAMGFVAETPDPAAPPHRPGENAAQLLPSLFAVTERGRVAFAAGGYEADTASPDSPPPPTVSVWAAAAPLPPTRRWEAWCVSRPRLWASAGTAEAARAGLRAAVEAWAERELGGPAAVRWFDPAAHLTHGDRCRVLPARPEDDPLHSQGVVFLEYRGPLAAVLVPCDRRGFRAAEVAPASLVLAGEPGRLW